MSYQNWIWYNSSRTSKWFKAIENMLTRCEAWTWRCLLDCKLEELGTINKTSFFWHQRFLLWLLHSTQVITRTNSRHWWGLGNLPKLWERRQCSVAWRIVPVPEKQFRNCWYCFGTVFQFQFQFGTVLRSGTVFKLFKNEINSNI